MLRTLYAKLAAALLLLFSLLGLLYVAITLLSTRLYLQEANQHLHRGLARRLVSEGLIGARGEVDEAALGDIFHTLMVINPSIECYLLDREGRLLAFSAPPGKVKAKRVALAPIERFLRASRGGPVLGDDPRHPGVRRVFSVAPVERDGARRGYLYVILAGERYQSAFQALRQSYITRMSVGLVCAGLLFVFTAGLLFFHLLTRPLRRLTAAVESFPGQGPAPHGRSAAGDEIDRLEASFHDMAARIEAQMQRLQAADHERRQLVSNISHDLRTPLASIQGHLETVTLKSESLSPEERRRYLEVAMASCRRLSRLIAELFELARLDSPETRLQAERFPLPELVHDVVQKLELAVEAKGLTVEVRRGESIPFVHADIGLVERILENLLKNAIEHSPEGGVIRVDFCRTAGEAVEVRVTDRGPGIDPEDTTRIFERFYRVRQESHPRAAGCGLGLAIVKRIVDLHGGVVHAGRGPEGGATFAFTLPVA